MKILCSTNMPFAAEAFGTLGEVTIKEGREIGPEDVQDVDIFATRSTTQVTPAFLDSDRLKFIGTATIGVDHIAKEIRESDFPWCFSPGCNATSVAEWLVAVCLEWCVKENRRLQDLTLGIVGVGQVGSRIARRAEALGMRVLLNDPPRAEREGSDGFTELDELLAGSDIVTLHTPLEREGGHPTYHLADAGFFERIKPGALLVNAARGGIIDSDALITAVDSGRVGTLVLDAWEGEPLVRADVLERVWFATPHIAGHSFEGKAMGTVMVYQAACQALGLESRWSIDEHWPEPPVPEVRWEPSDLPLESQLLGLIRPVYSIAEDDQRFRESQGSGDEQERRSGFDACRKNYPMRREFRFTTVVMSQPQPELERLLRALEFQVAVG